MADGWLATPPASLRSLPLPSGWTRFTYATDFPGFRCNQSAPVSQGWAPCILLRDTFSWVISRPALRAFRSGRASILERYEGWWCRCCWLFPWICHRTERGERWFDWRQWVHLCRQRKRINLKWNCWDCLTAFFCDPLFFSAYIIFDYDQNYKPHNSIQY